jgi:hypothetical protein
MKKLVTRDCIYCGKEYQSYLDEKNINPNTGKPTNGSVCHKCRAERGWGGYGGRTVKELREIERRNTAEVKILSREEIEAIAHTLTPPKTKPKAQYLRTY